MSFNPRVFGEIMGDMVARLVSATPLTDVNFGSVWTTMLEAAASEDDEQYFQMLEIIRAYSLDTTTGSDLDARAAETVGERLGAEQATSFVTISDSAITKIETSTYAGLQGAVQDQTFLYGDGATGFSTAGSLIVGRGTPNAETISYTSITVFANYVRYNLSAGLQFDHGTDETIILAQGGNRTILSGTVVYVPESDISEQIEYETTADATILDGESEITEVPINASEAGTAANVPIGSIQQFDSLPFLTAEVRNPFKITNGRDIESDQELRDRIKDHVQSLSRGTKKSISTGISGLVSPTDNKRVISSSIIEPTIPADVVKLFIDDGSGSIFEFTNIGSETIVTAATGGEQFVNVINFPMVKAFSSTQAQEPFNLNGGEILFVDVGGAVETIIFASTDFDIPGEATAQEIVEKLNANAKSFEARVTGIEANEVKIFSRANVNEEIRVTGGTANDELLFPVDTKFTSKLYRTRDNKIELLSKDGRTAIIESGNTQGYDLSGDFRHLSIIVDGKDQCQHLKFKPVIDFVNPVSATVDEVVALMNLQVQGAIIQESSNGNKFRFSSKTERSEDSKFRVVENFTKIFSEEASVNIDRTSDLQNNASTTPIFSDNLDYVYLGHTDVRFGSIYASLTVDATANVDFAFEYWDGTSWIEIGVHDTTLGFTQSGHIFFEPPFDWATTVVEGFEGYFVRLQRNQAIAITPPSAEVVRVCSANEAFGFSETEVSGTGNDYTINRFIGQIELNEPLEPDDKLDIGTIDTRPIVLSSNGNWNGLVGQQLEINIDGTLGSYTFQNSDFFDPLSALPGEVRLAINNNFSGIVATDDGTNIKIQGNSYVNGFIQVSNSGANLILQFDTDKLESLDPHVASLESTIVGPYTFQTDSNLIVIVDGNLINTYDIPVSYTATLTGSTTTVLTDTTLNTIFPLASNLEGAYEVLINSGLAIGERRDISAYNPATGEITVSSAFSVNPGTEEYYIFPKEAQEVIDFFNNTKLTLLSKGAEVRITGGGFIQISSKQTGETGSINVPGGNANALLGFSTVEKVGVDGYRYYIGLPQLVQWTVDGREDSEEYEGIRAAGVQVEVSEPVKIPVSIQLDITPQEGTTLSSITNSIKSAVTNIVNALGVGQDVILSDITVAVKEVVGVFDSKIVSPLENIAIADSEQAKITEKDISVG
jgi:uncharacterized phage protein gp47/JayE